MKRAIRRLNASSDFGLDRAESRAEKFRQFARAQREPRDDAELPPPPPLSAQNKSGFVQAFAMRTLPSAVTISASDEAGGRHAVAFGEAAEAAALNQPCHTDGAHPPPCT